MTASGHNASTARSGDPSPHLSAFSCSPSEEVESAISAGADELLLPIVHTCDEVDRTAHDLRPFAALDRVLERLPLWRPLLPFQVFTAELPAEAADQNVVSKVSTAVQ